MMIFATVCIVELISSTNGAMVEKFVPLKVILLMESTPDDLQI